MKIRVLTLLASAVLPLSVAVAGSAGGAIGVPRPARTESIRTNMSPAERGEAIRQFVHKWGRWVQSVYATDVETWAMRMVPQFAYGDAANIDRALRRATFEGALAELDGRGHRIADAKALRTAAALAPNASAPAALLGDLASDTVFTPIAPCRIADTRVTGGALAAGETRSFGAWGFAAYTSWGGSSSNCGMQAIHPKAVLLNVTAVSPTGNGYATVFAADLASAPFVASVNYSSGAIVNNQVLTAINPGSYPDYKIYSFAGSHYVVDIVGYYAAPVATPLDCQDVQLASTTVAANSTFDLAIPGCPTGYSLTGAGCRTPGFDDATWAINGLYPTGSGGAATYCSGKNNKATATSVSGVAHCCRIPGR